ncbi:hypothetical protein GCM10010399_40280 [Dactylosporangium fulvum]|uniref:Glycoside hydrolase family 55 protein n=1 Tax=Dactylosporangium fulvum TaxID=53359 RepID=A0ABY5VZ90_9ACTN|nr:glycoside hydrolase family 55 protein [Dactylosporangium fulvum]UWP83027.1 glycoside hydrolase family 55 protein [Dactylosporangium fulvum]
MTSADRDHAALSRRRMLAGGGATILGASAVTAIGVAVAKPHASPPIAGGTDWIDVRDHGAQGDGVTDDTQAIKSAIAAAANGGVVTFGVNKTYRIRGRIDMPVGLVGYQGNGSTLNCAEVPDTDRYAIRFVPSPAPAADPNMFTERWTYSYWCEGLRIVGPSDNGRDTARALDGIFIGRPPEVDEGNVAGMSFYNVVVRGFRDNWTIADQSWLLAFYHCYSSNAWRRAYHFESIVNAGENYNFHGGVIHGNAIGVHANVEGNSDINFFGVSFDYNELHMQLESGITTLTGCHLEDRNTSPMITVLSTGGKEPAKLDLVSCVVAGTETSAGGRRSFVTVSGDRSVVRVHGGAWPRYDRPDSELVTVPPGAGRPLVSVEHVDPVIKENAAPRISGVTSLVHNGGFEDGLTGWTLSASGSAGSHAVDTSVRRSGNASLRIAKSAAGNYGFWRDVPVTPGGRLLVRGYIRAQALNAGGGFRVDWLDFGGVEVAAREDAVGGTVSGTTDWIQRSATLAVPVGAARARVWAWTIASSGSMWFDDIEAWNL